MFIALEDHYKILQIGSFFKPFARHHDFWNILLGIFSHNNLRFTLRWTVIQLQGCKAFFMLKSNEHEIYHAHKCCWHFISKLATLYKSLKARKVLLFQHFRFYDQLKPQAQLS